MGLTSSHSYPCQLICHNARSLWSFMSPHPTPQPGKLNYSQLGIIPKSPFRCRNLLLWLINQTQPRSVSSAESFLLTIKQNQMFAGPGSSGLVTKSTSTSTCKLNMQHICTSVWFWVKSWKRWLICSHVCLSWKTFPPAISLTQSNRSVHCLKLTFTSDDIFFILLYWLLCFHAHMEHFESPPSAKSVISMFCVVKVWTFNNL